MSGQWFSALREIVDERTLGWVPIEEWGPKCAGCGADEYRIDGYCSVDCRDYHDDFHIAELAPLIDIAEAAELCVKTWETHGYAENLSLDILTLREVLRAGTCQEQSK